MELRSALCLDLDGTIRHSKSGEEFIQGATDVALLFDNVEERIWQYRDKGYLIFGITNQGGVALGFKTPGECSAEIIATRSLFRHDPFYDVFYCYYHEGGNVEPYNFRSLLRKPDIGMLVMCEIKAWVDGYIIDWDNSLFVGDRPEDELCAKNAKVSFRWAWEFFGRLPRKE